MIKLRDAMSLSKVKPHHWNLARVLTALGVVSGVTAGLTAGATLLLRVLDKGSRWSEPLLAATLAAVLLGALAGATAQLLGMRKERLTHSREWQRNLEQQLTIGPFEGRLPALSELSDPQLGVTETRYTKLGHDAYVRRPDSDAKLIARLGATRAPFPFVLVTGRSISGKSRTLVHALRTRFAGSDPVVIIPRDGTALENLAQMDVEVPPGGTPAIVYLDDLTSSLLSHLNTSQIDKIRRFCLVVGSMSSNRYVEILDSRSDITTGAREALRKAGDPIEVEFSLTASERAEAERLYKNEEFPDGCSIAEVLVAGDRLVRKLRTGFDPRTEDKVNWPGQAIARAAIDCRRYGINRPIRTSEIRALFDSYLDSAHANATIDDSTFEAGLAWAAEPVESQVALLHRARSSDHEQAWDVFRFAVDSEDGLVDGQDRPIPPELLSALLPVVNQEDMFNIAVAAYLRSDTEGAISALRQLLDGPETDMTAAAAFNLGVLLENADLVDDAVGAYELVTGTDDVDLAPRAAINLGDLLDRMNRQEEAKAVYASAVNSGHRKYAPEAAFNLAGMLARAGELEDAAQNYRFVISRGHADLERKARAQLSILADLASPHSRTLMMVVPTQTVVERTNVFGGDLVYFTDQIDQDRTTSLNRLKHSREATNEEPRKAFNLGISLTSADRLDEAIEAYEVAIRLNDQEFGPKSYHNIALIYQALNKHDRAISSATSALKWPNGKLGPISLYNIALLLESLGESERAAEACLRALASNHRTQVTRTAHRIAALLHRIGRVDEATEAYQTAIQSADEQTRLRASINLGILHARRGNYDEALNIWQHVTDTGRDEFARKAAFNRALVLDKLGETSKAIRDLKYAVASNTATVSQHAHEVLEQLRAEGWEC